MLFVVRSAYGGRNPPSADEIATRRNPAEARWICSVLQCDEGARFRYVRQHTVSYAAISLEETTELCYDSNGQHEGRRVASVDTANGSTR